MTYNTASHLSVLLCGTTTISEDEAKTVILEKENELKEKVGSEGLNTRVFKR